MGFGLPSALGAAAAYAEPGRDAKVVVDIDGDGSFLMNIQAWIFPRVCTLHFLMAPWC